jgi:hypothetical protein
MAIPRNLSILAQGVSASGVLAVTYGGTGVTTSTGTGNVVLSSSPTLVTPTIGAASATSITASLGAVGTPSYTFTGDTNTGIFSPAADTIALVTAGTEDFRIGPSGQFGVQGANYGTAGQVLTSGGASAAPSWATPSGGVTSLAAGNGITVSGSTGAVTVSQDIYTGTSATNTSFPIGSTVVTNFEGGLGAINLAASQTLYVSTSTAADYVSVRSGGGRSALTGTWRARGTIIANSGSDYGWLFQRTA